MLNSNINLIKLRVIRSCLRSLRRNFLTPQERYVSGKQIVKQVFEQKIINNFKNIGIFSSFDGEINTYPLILKLWSFGYNVFLPILNSSCIKNLMFSKYTSNSLLKLNQLGILEPIIIKNFLIPVNELDLIFVPFVAFDKKGNRLGMGKGFYDTVLRDWDKNNVLPIGLGYDFQLLHSFPVNSWDIPLPIVLTPSMSYFFIN